MESSINEKMEEVLMKGEKHFEILKKEQLAKLQKEREGLISEYIEDAYERDLSSMEDDVWELFLEAKKKQHLEKIKAELQAEKERQERLKAEQEEKERIMLENAKLKAQQEEKERLYKIEQQKIQKEELERKRKEEEQKKIQQEKERKIKEEYEAKLRIEREEKKRIEREEKLKLEKIQAQLKAKKEEEIRIQKEKEAKIQIELNKGDEEKVKDLISDLIELKTKYSFKSNINKKMRENVSILIDKTVLYIKEHKYAK